MSERAKISSKKPEAKTENYVSHTRKIDFSQSVNSPIDHILTLQKTIGNQAVQRLIKSGTIQAKLKTDQPGDIYEQQADRVGELAMLMPEAQVLWQSEEEYEKEILKAKETPGHPPKVTPGLEARMHALKGPIQLFPETARTFMETKSRADLSGVTVNADSHAMQISKELNVEAFTYGKDTYFGAGRYSPGISSGKRLMAHDLTRVVQQKGAVQPRFADGQQRITRKNEADLIAQDEKYMTDGMLNMPRQINTGSSSYDLQRQVAKREIKPFAPKRRPNDIWLAIDIFAQSKTSRTSTGRKVLAKLKELYEKEEMGLEELQPGLCGVYRPGTSVWGRRFGRYLALNEQQTLAHMATKMVHEAVHALEIKRHPLDDELAAFTFEGQYYEELKSGGLDILINPKRHGSIERFLELKKQNKAIDFLFPSYRRHLDVSWILQHIDDWGGISNREAETKAAYVIKLAEEDNRYLDLIDKLIVAKEDLRSIYVETQPDYNKALRNLKERYNFQPTGEKQGRP